MEKRIGYAVVGLGVGMGHCEGAIASEYADLVAVCDLIPEKMEKVAAKCPGLKMYTEFQDLITDPGVDIISICLPSSMHAEFAVKAMEAGKHVLVEKPIDIHVKDAMKIEEARIRTGMKAGVIHQNRFNRDMFPIKAAVESGRTGKTIVFD